MRLHGQASREAELREIDKKTRPPLRIVYQLPDNPQPLDEVILIDLDQEPNVESHLC